MSQKIDFVVTWVDGSDPEWLREKNEFQSCPKSKIDASENRYKDWGLFKYWFRGVEKFAPWVNRIYLITWGHLPEWINLDNSKLVIVNHKDYIPNEYLPTFNSNVIELNIHRIRELSENFVLFNDDFYLINKTKEEDFFIDGVPCDTISLNVHCPKKSAIIQNICNNDVGIINEHFDFKKTFNANRKKWLSLKNGKYILRTIALMSCPRYPGFWQHHLPMSYNKKIFETIWEKEPDVLEETSRNKFRSKDDVNHWLMKEWQIVTGNFKNRSVKFGKFYNIEGQDIDRIVCDILNSIRNQKYKCVALNDSSLTDERYGELMPIIVDAFETILPEKSSFEK